jgi:hypothetical protein
MCLFDFSPSEKKLRRKTNSNPHQIKISFFLNQTYSYTVRKEYGFFFNSDFFLFITNLLILFWLFSFLSFFAFLRNYNTDFTQCTRKAMPVVIHAAQHLV